MFDRLRIARRTALALFVCVPLIFIGWAQAQPRSGLARRILLIRHAEKLDPPVDEHLSPEGKERAKHLHKLFDSPGGLPKPDFVFAARNSEKSHRSVETVEPLVARLKVPFDQTYRNKPTAEDKKSVDALAHELRTNPKYAGKTVLVAWHHGTMPELLRAFGVKNGPDHWENKTFDRVWSITYDAAGTPTFADLPQRLLKGDSAK
jgi:hypothetical protein